VNGAAIGAVFRTMLFVVAIGAGFIYAGRILERVDQISERLVKIEANIETVSLRLATEHTAIKDRLMRLELQAAKRAE